MKKIISATLLMLVIFTFTAFSVSAEAEAPKAPETVTATSTANSITVNWSAVEDADGYRLYYKTPTATAWKKCVSSTANTSHTFTKIASGYAYTIAVRSYKLADDNSVIWGYILNSYNSYTACSNSKDYSYTKRKRNQAHMGRCQGRYSLQSVCCRKRQLEAPWLYNKSLRYYHKAQCR